MNTHNILKGVLFSITLSCCIHVHGQENQALIEGHYFYEDGVSYFDSELYGLSLRAFERTEYSDKAVSYQALSSFEMQENRSIDLMLESISRGVSDVVKNETYSIIGTRYFQNKDYDQAREFYNKINLDVLDFDERQSVNFKLGYCYLTDKRFNEAIPHFKSVSGYNGLLKDDATYYEGICQYYLDDKEAAIRSFTKIENKHRYKNLVPFYLAQIYFKDQEYDKAIEYGESRLSNKDNTNKSLVNRILGMSYLAKEDYSNALPYLNAYAESTDKLTENEFYQIGVLNYRLGKTEEAQEYFKELSHQDSKLGQLSNYLLASTSLKMNNKKDAQSAFWQASKLNYFPDLQRESEFLYYKISGELGDERIAVSGLSVLPEDSEYYPESQNLLSDLLLRAEDKANAMKTIENLKSKNTALLNTYKTLAYELALENIEDRHLTEATSNLRTSIETPGDADLTSKAHFWMGHANNELGDIQKSEKALRSYLESGHEEYAFESHYLMAYQQMESQHYDKAIGTLEESIESFDAKNDDKALFDDALVRLADLELVKNNYSKAIEYYDLAISNNAQESDYILYQKALIYGVNNQIIEKLTTLERLVKNYPQSKYQDDSYFQIGETLIALGKNNDAYRVYTSLILEFGSKSPYTSLSHMRKGLISYNQGDLHAALDSYKQGIKLTDDKDEKRRALKAVEEIYLNELNDSDAYFAFTEEETGYKLDDISKDSISFKVALNSYKDNFYEKAIGQFETYIQKYPQGFYITDAYYYTAESYVVIKNYNNGLINYEKVLSRKSSSFYKPSLEKAALIAYNHNQNFDKSLKYFGELIEGSSEVNLDHLEGALYCAFASGRQESILDYGALLIQQSNASQASKATAHYYLGKTYLSHKKYAESIASFKNAAGLSANYQAAESSFLIAKIYFDTDRIEEAEEQAFETTKKAANYPIWVAKSLVLLGDIFAKKKDYLNATAAYESVLENFKDNAEIIQETKSKLTELNKIIQSGSRIKNESDLEFIESDTIR